MCTCCYEIGPEGTRCQAGYSVLGVCIWVCLSVCAVSVCSVCVLCLCVLYMSVAVVCVCRRVLLRSSLPCQLAPRTHQELAAWRYNPLCNGTPFFIWDGASGSVGAWYSELSLSYPPQVSVMMDFHGYNIPYREFYDMIYWWGGGMGKVDMRYFYFPFHFHFKSLCGWVFRGFQTFSVCKSKVRTPGSFKLWQETDA